VESAKNGDLDIFITDFKNLKQKYTKIKKELHTLQSEQKNRQENKSDTPKDEEDKKDECRNCKNIDLKLEMN